MCVFFLILPAWNREQLAYRRHICGREEGRVPLLCPQKPPLLLLCAHLCTSLPRSHRPEATLERSETLPSRVYHVPAATSGHLFHMMLLSTEPTHPQALFFSPAVSSSLTRLSPIIPIPWRGTLTLAPFFFFFFLLNLTPYHGESVSMPPKPGGSSSLSRC